MDNYRLPKRIAFEQYISQYPRGCDGCNWPYALYMIYPMQRDEGYTGTVCNRVIDGDTERCPCRDCLVKVKCEAQLYGECDMKYEQVKNDT